MQLGSLAPAAEELECRTLLAAFFFSGIGELLVTVDNSDNAVITESGGVVAVNGVDPDTGPLPVNTVQSIRVEGGAGPNLIDLSGVSTAVGFLPTLSITVHGSDGADTIFTSPLGGQYFGDHDNDLLQGNTGSDTLLGDDGADTLLGAGGDDSLLGEDGDDSILGGTGNDTIDAGHGMDFADGQVGDDSILGGDGADTLQGNTGNDFLNGGAGRDVVNGGTGDDLILGGADEDLLSGDAGDDLLRGQGGSDTLDGGGDNDRLDGGTESDLLLGGDASDTLLGRQGGDTLDGGIGNDLLNGQGDDDTLIGDLGDDTLRGGAGKDMLFGDFNDPNQRGIGVDVLRGQGNADTLNGGGGPDDMDGGSGDDLVLSGLFNPQPLELSINNVRVNEGNAGTTNATFTVTLSAISTGTVTVDFATQDDTATGGMTPVTPGADYVTTGGTLQFLPGVTTQTINVEVIGDTVDELVETFLVNLSNPLGAVIADNQGRGRIIDDDVTPQDVDIFLHFDDTISFQPVAPALVAAFPMVIASLQMQLPGSSLAFGIGRFESYSNFSGDFSAEARPFTLNQPIIADTVPMFSQAIDAALMRTTPGSGDMISPTIETLFQIATGAGFDHNGDGDTVDSGPAGLYTTQVTPGPSGDVPDFASFMQDLVGDPNGPILLPSGNIGGVGFRPGTQRLVLLGTDAAFRFGADGVDPVTGIYTGVGGVTVPAPDIRQGGSTNVPAGGATIQNTIDQLVAQNIQVIGLGDSTAPLSTPRRQLEAVSTLTGAINNTAMAVENGITPGPSADDIQPGDPFYFFIDPTSPTVADDLANAIIAAVGASVQALPELSIDDVSLDPEGDVGTTNLTFTVSLDVPAPSDIFVDFNTVDGSALAGVDYAFTAGTAMIPMGMQTTTISVPVIGDILNELTESFFVQLSNPVGAMLVLDQGEGSIVDDDDPLDRVGDTLRGSDGNDTLRGADGDDFLNGGGGNDLLDGGAGDDSGLGGGGVDTLNGNAGDDTLDGQGAADVVFGDLDIGDPDYFALIHNGNDVVVWAGDQSDDVVDGGLGFDQLVVNTKTENDTVSISASGSKILVNASTPADPVGDTVTARNFEAIAVNTNAGRDTVHVGDLAFIQAMQLVQVNAGPGHDLVDASPLSDPSLRLLVNGGDGNDTLIGGDGEDILNGEAGDDSVTGGDGDDSLDGGDGRDTLDGGAGDDVLRGLAHNDTLLGMTGRDTLDGGSHDDLLDGGADDDLLLGNPGDDSLLGVGGRDTLNGGDGDDTLDGGDGNDSLLGTAGLDSLRGEAGNDTLDGGDDSDTLVGGDGNDLLTGGAANDFLNGNAGNDTLLGGLGDDTALGGADDDQIFGDSGNDSLNGNAGADSLRGAHGEDTLRGGTGDDRLNGGDGNDNLSGDDGRDGLAGHDGNDTLNGGGEQDTLIAGDGDDILRGGADTDFLVGNQGADDLDGQGSVDTLSGGEGTDTLTGVPDDVIDESIEAFFDPSNPEFAWINAV